MANYDELLELVYEYTSSEDDVFKKYVTLTTLKTEFTKAKKEKDFKKMKDLVKDAETVTDTIISDIDSMKIEAGDKPKAIAICNALSKVLSIPLLMSMYKNYIPKSLKEEYIYDVDMNEYVSATTSLGDKLISIENVLKKITIPSTLAGIATKSVQKSLETKDTKEMIERFGITRSDLKKVAKKVKNMLSKMQKDIDKMEKRERSAMRESTQVDSITDLKLAIYESEAAGEITAEEREFLIHNL